MVLCCGSVGRQGVSSGSFFLEKCFHAKQSVLSPTGAVVLLRGWNSAARLFLSNKHVGCSGEVWG